MFPKTNLHTHTVYCDGKLTAAEMVNAAIEKKLETIGFSGHAHMPGIGQDWCMSVEDTAAYRAATKALALGRADEIEIVTGIEQDVFSDLPTGGYDYVIGAVHYVKKDGEFLAVDHSEEMFANEVNKIYRGDYIAFARDFYEISASAPKITGADIVAHFDLVKKFNAGGKYFSDSDRRYRDAAIGALCEAAKSGAIFEINTGGAYRGYNDEFYPAPFLLRELKNIGGRITFSSDSHDARSLCYGFPAARRIAKECGFKTAWTWKDGGFKEFKI